MFRPWLFEDTIGALGQYGANIKLGFDYYQLMNYDGPCVRVVRSSDSTSKDFGFVNGYIDYNGILAFVGAGTGYVSIWYNQAGGNNAVQNTAGNRPIIVSSGVFESTGLKFVTADVRYLELANYTGINLTTPPVSIYINYVPGAGPGVVFYKNDVALVQYALINYSFRINTSVGANAFTHSATTGLVTKSLYIWADKNTNGLTGNQNGAVLSATQATDTGLGTIITLGARVVSGVSVPMQGNMRSFVLANTVMDYSVVTSKL
jgi:hypothetical protein